MTIRIACAILGLTSAAVGQDTSVPAAAQPAEEAAQSAAMPSIIQTLPDYTGDLAHRKYLTGDWGGARTELANKGVLFDLDVTQVLQGNAHGGKPMTVSSEPRPSPQAAVRTCAGSCLW